MSDTPTRKPKPQQPHKEDDVERDLDEALEETFPGVHRYVTTAAS